MRPRRIRFLLFGAFGLACAVALNARAKLVPRFGQWYPADTHPAVLLQLRSWFAGRLAPMPDPACGWYDYVWGRGGMHSNFGLGLPILSLPFHLVARAFGAPGFPDQLRFLVLYALTAALLAAALHGASRKATTDLAASMGVAAFVLLFPTYVGLMAVRFLIYDQTIAAASLWALLLLAGVLALLERATPARFVVVCAAAAFAIFFRAPFGAYGMTTVGVAAIVAHRGGLSRRGLAAGATASVLVAAAYLFGNFLRFGSPFDAGYANIVSSPFVNRLTRWGLDFVHAPFGAAVREMFATLFLLRPLPGPVIAASPAGVPAEMAPFVVPAERWREYSSPTYDLFVFAGWMLAFAAVAWRVARKRLWRADRDLRGEVATIVGLWALPPSLVLFVFYAKISNFATRYAVDLYPALVGALVCVGMVAVDLVRERAPRRAGAAQAAAAVVACLYMGLAPGWPQARERPVDGATVEARLAGIEAKIGHQPVPAPHLEAGAPRGAEPVYGQLSGWGADGAVGSGMEFAFPESPCVTFTFAARGKGAWGAAEDEALAGFRVDADFDAMARCGAPRVMSDQRAVTMCEPRPPRFVLDGMRLYAVAWLDARQRPIDRLRLLAIDGAPSCQ